MWAYRHQFVSLLERDFWELEFDLAGKTFVQRFLQQFRRQAVNQLFNGVRNKRGQEHDHWDAIVILAQVRDLQCDAIQFFIGGWKQNQSFNKYICHN